MSPADFKASCALMQRSAMPTGKPLRVALVTETFPPEVNGVAMTAGRIVDGLLAAGHHVHVVRPSQPEEGDHRASDGRRLTTTLVPGFGMPGYHGVRFGWPAARKLAGLWQQQPPDLVHVLTEGPLGYSALCAATQRQLPLVGGYHTHFDHYEAGIEPSVGSRGDSYDNALAEPSTGCARPN